MNQQSEDDFPRSGHPGRSDFGARDNRSGYRREESYEERREDSYGGRQTNRYGDNREDNLGGRRNDSYGGRIEDSYDNRRKDNYGGRRNDDYNSAPHKQPGYGREDNEYDGRDENKYGREENKYGREENKYGREENKYGREENKYGREENKYGREENKYGREENKYGREENKYDREENKYGREENKYGREENKYGREENKYGREEENSYEGSNGYGKQHKTKPQSSYNRDDDDNEYKKNDTSSYNRPYNNGASQGGYVTGNNREDEYGSESQYGIPDKINRPGQYNNNGNNNNGYGGSNNTNNGGHGGNGNNSNNTHHGGNMPYGGASSHFSAPPSQPQSFGVEGYQFQYSACTGRRKALLIGINYIGSKQQLKGCINDVKNIKNFLLQHEYKEDDMVILTDDLEPASQPTRENMLRGMKWLVKDAKPDDSYFFHYSGHGGLTPDLNGDEESGKDDVIYPLDFETAGSIIDDDIHDIMVRPLPQGARLTALFDCCNSGTALDLPYFYSTKGLLKEPNLIKEAGEGLLSAYKSYTSGDIDGMVSQVTSLFNRVSVGKEGYEAVKKTKTSPSDVVMFSGCKDDQTSADTFADGQATGAMSHAFVKIMTETPNQSYLTLLQNLRQLLEEGNYTQKPQLSSSHPIDVNLKFIF
ncbi:hypothetical protein D0Z00_000431 [Geotrichum galactomycetum]|uniref:Uncharacterized protein n=1 Tax=Geotrichum galactomycetum TaxID=27317 RepID=A0ACB6V9M2_9ASCO|nr:hypothetical protein D0Z00_000431 [Geotrichum candidum]